MLYVAQYIQTKVMFNLQSVYLQYVLKITPLYNNRSACSFLSIDDVHSNAPCSLQSTK